MKGYHMRSRFLLPCVVAVLAGCTWVKLTDAGAGVRTATAGEVEGCDRVGSVTATTRDRVLLKRSDTKVREELIVLASNEAGRLGGDAMVPQSPPRDGEQSYDVYRCGAASG